MTDNWYLANRSKVLSKQKSYRESHKEEVSARRKTYLKKNRDKVNAYARKYRSSRGREYGRLVERRVREKKYGVKYPTKTNCGICGKPLEGRRINLDHSHLTSLFRGWLCVCCNRHLGWFEKYKLFLKKYLGENL